MVGLPTGLIVAGSLIPASRLLGRWSARKIEKDLRSLPVGLEVQHLFSPACAVETGQPIGWRFIWPFQTQVTVILDRPLRIEAYGMGVWHSGRWIYNRSRLAFCLGPFSTLNCTVFSSKDFERDFNCPGGWLEPGIGAWDRQNWAASGRLKSFRQNWFFIGRDEEGRYYKGEAIIDLQGYLA